eukprot:COSAG02_NODE_19811_length_863_cov_3.143979_2_plen_77_part_00
MYATLKATAADRIDRVVGEPGTEAEVEASALRIEQSKGNASGPQSILYEFIGGGGRQAIGGRQAERDSAERERRGG